MFKFYGLFFLFFSFMFLACGLFQDEVDLRECAELEQDDCQKRATIWNKKQKRCAWNVDRCQDRLMVTAPDVPKSLTNVKLVAVGEKGYCAIDGNDELWCIPNSESEEILYPHPSRKFRHVAMGRRSFADTGVCATKLDGTSICFDKKLKEEEKGPTQDKVLQTIPGWSHDTVCAFSESRVWCESTQLSFEKFDAYFQKQMTALENAGVVDPKLEALFIRGESLGYKKERIYVRLTNKTLLGFIRDDVEADKWKWIEMQDGSDFKFQNTSDASVYGGAFCFIGGNKKISCASNDTGTIFERANIPDDIKNTKIKLVAISSEHGCVATDSNGELKCWGSKKQIKNAPSGVTGVTQIAASRSLTCYIDGNKKLNCFKAE